MLIVADENIPLVEAWFEELGRVVRVPGREMNAALVKDADLLLVRSVTRVDEHLLAGSRVGFVGTATIGTDHVDENYLASRGIGFANAPGSNAESVVDYVLSVVFNLLRRQSVELRGRRFGIVGAGNVGGRLCRRLQQAGLSCLVNDPPKAEKEAGSGGHGDYVSMDTLISDCDIICLHTPLTREGPHSTFHLFNEERLQALRPGTLLINAGRGEVVDNTALGRVLAVRKDLRVALDVWEQEPGIDPRLAAQVDLATPHIAGYSLDGKLKGTEMIAAAAYRHLGLTLEHRLADLAPTATLNTLVLDPRSLKAEPDVDRLICRVINLCYDVRDDDEQLRQTLAGDARERAQAFDRLRKYYPVRREFSTLGVGGIDPSSDLGLKLNALGFRIAREF